MELQQILPWLILQDGLSHASDIATLERPGGSSTPNSYYRVMLNVKHFKPQELTVKVVDNCFVVHGKQEDGVDEHGFISREFTRRYPIPEDVEIEKAKSALAQNGILTIEAPKKGDPSQSNGMVIPILIQRTAAADPSGVREMHQEMEVQRDQKPEEKESTQK